MEFEYLVDGALRKIAIEKRDGMYIVHDGDAAIEAEIRAVSDHELFILSRGRGHRIFLAREGDRTLIQSGGRMVELREPGRDGGASAKGEDGAPDGGGVIKAPMPGKVIKVFVAEGETVRKNQTLLIVEAMKMENEIKAGREGVVKKVHVAAGELVDAARPLIEIE